MCCFRVCFVVTHRGRASVILHGLISNKNISIQLKIKSGTNGVFSKVVLEFQNFVYDFCVVGGDV